MSSMEEGLINTTRATPRWVARAVAAGEFVGLRPGHNAHRFYFIALVQFALSAAALLKTLSLATLKSPPVPVAISNRWPAWPGRW